MTDQELERVAIELQPYAMSVYPGEHKLVKSHPSNLGEEQWYKREDVDIILSALKQVQQPNVQKMREAFESIILVLGPTPPNCCCQGCQIEMGEALRIARAALSGQKEEKQ